MANNNTLTIPVSISDGNGAPVSKVLTFTGNRLFKYDDAPGGIVTNHAINCSVSHTTLQAMVVISYGFSVVIKVNSTSAPDETFTTVADVPLVWYTGSLLTVPLTNDVTVFYLTTTTAPTRVAIWCLDRSG